MTRPGDETASGRRIAPAAQRWLAQSTTARVLHIFESAAYLTSPQAGVLLVTRPPLGPGPFTLALAAPGIDFMETMKVGEQATVAPGKLAGAHWAIDATTARTWPAQPDWGALRRRPTLLAEALPIIRRALADRGARGPFGHILLGLEPPEPPEGVEARLQERARDGLAQLEAALDGGPRPSVEAAAAALAGLGGGFTPAGDDVLMGAMLAGWATRADEDASRIGEVIALAASSRTTTVSAAWLAAAARGEATQGWHDLVRAIAVGEERAVARATQTILETGHTSGEDALAGFLRLIQPIG